MDVFGHDDLDDLLRIRLETRTEQNTALAVPDAAAFEPIQLIRKIITVKKKIHIKKGIKCLTFDIIGTVFDFYGSLSISLKLLAWQYSLRIDAKAYALEWVDGYANAVLAINSGAKPWTAPDNILKEAFAALLADDKLPPPSAHELTDFLNLWRRLDPWPEVPKAMHKLHKRFNLVVLSNMGIATQTALKQHSGLPFDVTLSAETVGKYKPDPAVYQHAMSTLGLSAGEIMMVAAHKYDLKAAKSLGLRTAFVARPLERGPGGGVDTTPDPSFDINATSFEDLAHQLTTRIGTRSAK